MKALRLLLCLMIAGIGVAGSGGCDRSPQEEQDETAGSSVPAWLFRGGDMSRASLMSDWKLRDQESRLAASADLVTMQLRNTGQPIPAPAELTALSRSLEAKLTEVSASGKRDGDYIGEVVDEIWPSLQ